MTIIRDGKEIELSPFELEEAYREQERKNDIKSVIDMVSLVFLPDIEDEWLIQRILEDEVMISRIASEKRRRMDDYDIGEQAAMDESIDEAVRELLESKRSDAPMTSEEIQNAIKILEDGEWWRYCAIPSDTDAGDQLNHALDLAILALQAQIK